MGVVVIGILVGLDNLAVASGLGMLGLGRGRRLGFAVSCSCFEALAPVLGVWIGLGFAHRIGPAVEWIGPACLATCGLLVLDAAVRQSGGLFAPRPATGDGLGPLDAEPRQLGGGGGAGDLRPRRPPPAAAVGVISGGHVGGGFRHRGATPNPLSAFRKGGRRQLAPRVRRLLPLRGPHLRGIRDDDSQLRFGYQAACSRSSWAKCAGGST